VPSLSSGLRSPFLDLSTNLFETEGALCLCRTNTFIDSREQLVGFFRILSIKPLNANAFQIDLPASAAFAARPDAIHPFFVFLMLGLEHILTGHDHLLFLFGLLVVCRDMRSILTLITCFTIAHSITLALAALGVVQLPARIVEPLIAASIAYVGVENLLRGEAAKRRWLITFVLDWSMGLGSLAH